MATALFFTEEAAYYKRVYQQGCKNCGAYPRKPTSQRLAATIGGRGDIGKKINSTSELQGIDQYAEGH